MSNKSLIINQVLLLSMISVIKCLVVTLSSEAKAVFVFNLSKVVPSTYNYSQLLAIKVVSQNRLAYNSSLGNISSQSQQGLKRIQIFNYQATQQKICLDIVNANGSYQVGLVNISTILMESQIIKRNFNQGIFMIRQNINNFMLPFNLISQKYKKIVVEQSLSHGREIKYDYQPFLETFWNQHNEDQLLLSWIPYFSMCQHKTSRRIFLQDIINPWESQEFQLYEIDKICNRIQSWLWGITLECSNKIILTQCILQQLNVQSTKKQPWWKNTANTIFYFLQPGIAAGSLLQLDNSNSLTQIFQQYYQNLIPLSYKPNFNLNSEAPNKFTLYLKIASINDVNYLQILQASLVAQKINSSNTDLDQGEVYLQLQVMYLDNFQTLFAYGKQTYIYIIIFTTIMIIFMLFNAALLTYCKIKLNLKILAKLIMFPAVKGFVISFIVCLSFLGCFFAIVSQTNLSVISVSFDGNTPSNTWKYYAGRVGLTIFLIGYFFLSAGISQSFKVMTPQQTKIIIEDDQIQKQRYQKIGSHEISEQEQNRHIFIINNMNSQRKYILSCILCYSFILLLIYYTQMSLNISSRIIYIVIGYPFIHKITVTVYRHIALKQLLYLSPILICLQSFLDIMVLGEMLMWQTLIFYFVKLISQNILCILLQIFAQWISFKSYNYIHIAEAAQIENYRFYRFLSYFKQQISSIVTQSRYQKALFYANMLNLRFASILCRPFFLILAYITIKYNYICKDFNQTKNQVFKISVILFCFIPIDIITILYGVKFFQVKFNLEIIKCLQFNKFKFSLRKVKWINDTFSQTQGVNSFYRQFQKFCFSSQLYILTFIISFALYTLMIGLKIIIQVKYVSFVDPAMILIICLVWLMGSASSIILSFISIKLKLFEKKEDGKMRATIQSLQKILKKTDYSEYLQTQKVKNYFLLHCKQWIIQNLTKIFDKQDFIDNNYQFLMKYKHYKSLLKKRKIEEKKEMQKKIQQSKNNLKLNEQKNNNKIVIKFPKKQFNQFSKPLVRSWLYIAKQFIFLKKLVCFIKETKKKQTCEFCSMNIQLDIIQKIQFASIVNEYRVLNVGRSFSSNHFINFYKCKQQYITICIECKDRKLHLQKKNLDVKGAPWRIIKKWLLITRSQLLHKKAKIPLKNYTSNK